MLDGMTGQKQHILFTRVGVRAVPDEVDNDPGQQHKNATHCSTSSGLRQIGLLVNPARLPQGDQRDEQDDVTDVDHEVSETGTEFDKRLVLEIVPERPGEGHKVTNTECNCHAGPRGSR